MQLEIKEVTKIFRRRGRSVTALDNLSLAVASQEFVCLIGPSGCGKSTVLNLLAGLDMPSDGQVLAGGALVQSANSAFAAGFLKAKPNLDNIYDLSLLNEVLKSIDLPEVH